MSNSMCFRVVEDHSYIELQKMPISGSFTLGKKELSILNSIGKGKKDYDKAGRERPM